MGQNAWKAIYKNQNSWYVRKVGFFPSFPILKIHTLKITSKKKKITSDFHLSLIYSFIFF